MKLLVTGDIHLDPVLVHEYRWKTLVTLQRHLMRDDVCALVIAGDLVDRKDKHPSKFVNRLITDIAVLGAAGRLVILKGNHDYIDRKYPFFGFLNHIEGVEYVSEPRVLEFGTHRVLFVPHGESWAPGRASWREHLPISGSPDGPWDLIVTHETFRGAMASTNQELDGIPLSAVDLESTRGAPVISGDIHVPQKLGNVLYAGSPHHVRFGDSFEPRLLLWDFAKKRASTIAMGGLRRLVVNYRREDGDLVGDVQPREGDHVKARFHGDESEQLRWAGTVADLRTMVEAVDAKFFAGEFVLEDSGPSEIADDALGRDDSQVFREYCEAHEIAAELIEGMSQWL